VAEFGLNLQPEKILLTYSCSNCNSSNCLTIKIPRTDNINSIQLGCCNNCGFKWKEILSSYSASMWSSQQHQHNNNYNQEEQQEQQLQTMLEVV
jgi:hypothetical protein